MRVNLLTMDQKQEVAEVDLPEPADLVVLGRHLKQRFFIRCEGEAMYREAIVAFVDAES